MRTSALPRFKKHWGRIEGGLDIGEYTVTIKNYYDVSNFAGKKYLVITTTNAFGGKNYKLGGIFIGISGLAILLCVVFLVLYTMNKQRDPIIVINKN